MAGFIHYFGRFSSARQSYRGLPKWAQVVILIAMIPGLIVAALSVLIFIVSIFVLLILAVPAYRFVKWLAGSQESSDIGPMPSVADPFSAVEVDMSASEQGNTPRRHINVRIVE